MHFDQINGASGADLADMWSDLFDIALAMHGPCHCSLAWCSLD
jgi:hypothetical protein